MKHMKKNDGYVMVYVMIVFTILSFVAVSICGMAVKNLQAQKATINRMAARYEAEAYLQEFIAQVSALDTVGTVNDADSEASAEDAARDNMMSKFLVDAQNIAGTFVEEETAYLTLLEDSTASQFSVFVSDLSGTVQIETKMTVTITEKYFDKTVTEAEPKWYSCKATIENVSIEYDSYDISYQTVDGGGEEVPDET